LPGLFDKRLHPGIIRQDCPHGPSGQVTGFDPLFESANGELGSPIVLAGARREYFQYLRVNIFVPPIHIAPCSIQGILSK
jgi:hypothetical protein